MTPAADKELIERLRDIAFAEDMEAVQLASDRLEALMAHNARLTEALERIAYQAHISGGQWGMETARTVLQEAKPEEARQSRKQEEQ